MEFREYEVYQPGNDIRHVDWRASLRHGDLREWVVRGFVAEENLTLVVSVDTRMSMWMPDGARKVDVAAWLAWALGRIGLASGDTLIVHRLFGPARSGHRTFRGSLARDGLWGGIRSVLGDEPQAADAEANTRGLDRLLSPTSVWLILSDFYIRPEQHSGLVNAVLAARDRSRWVVFGEMDSWPLEVARLGMGARRIEGPGAEEELECEVHATSLAEVALSITENREAWWARTKSRGSDRMHWRWPADSKADAEGVFKERLGKDPLLRQLFMRRGEA